MEVSNAPIVYISFPATSGCMIPRTEYRIKKTEVRSVLIKKVKELVYAEGEDQLEELYSLLQKTRRYPQFLSHMKSLWPRRNGHTVIENAYWFVAINFSEAGMKILKELIFSRVKAYNMVQVFQFLSETLESYYCRRLLCVSNTHT